VQIPLCLPPPPSQAPAWRLPARRAPPPACASGSRRPPGATQQRHDAPSPSRPLFLWLARALPNPSRHGRRAPLLCPVVLRHPRPRRHALELHLAALVLLVEGIDVGWPESLPVSPISSAGSDAAASKFAAVRHLLSPPSTLAYAG
jgi:hypothetical protein